MYLFSFLWNEILVLIFYISFIYAKDGHSIRWNVLHEYAYKFLYIDQHLGNNCVLFIELFTNRHVSVIKKNNYSIFISIVAIWLWGLRNNNLFYNLFQFLTFVLYFHYLHRIYIELEVGPFDKLAETYFFCWRLHKYELLQFVWY